MPILISPETYQVVEVPAENSDYIVSIPVEKSVIIACPGGYVLNTPFYEQTSTIYATCNSDSLLESQGHYLFFQNLACIPPRFEAVKTLRNSCWNNSETIEIGFTLGINIKVVPTLRVCFDTVKKIPLYTNYNVSKGIGKVFYQRNVDNVEDKDFFNLNVSMNSLYEIEYQKTILNQQLGLPADSQKYFNDTTCYFTCLYDATMCRSNNFFYIMQQMSIFRYVNTAPMWFSAFRSHWLDLENTIQWHAGGNAIDLEVYSGTFGIATLPHEETGEDVDLYLYNQGNEKSVAIPKYFWRLVYHRESKTAVVFLLYNNPIMLNDPLCNDIQADVPWLTWSDPLDITKGYGSACTYEDVSSKIPYMPSLEVEGLLV